MRFGHFDDEAKEYVVTTPLTPYPWINYLGSQEFFSLVSHQAGGYAFHRDAKLRRLTRFRYNNIPTDAGGRYFYIHDDGDVWTPSYLPVKAEPDAWECRHGLGYTRITAARGGLECSQLMFVPVEENAEIHHVSLRNTTDAPKQVKLFSYLEFCLWNAADDQNNYQRNLSLGEVEVEGSAIYHTTEYRERRNHYAVYAVNAPVVGFDTDRETFVGLYNTLAEAQVPLAGEPRNSVASGWYPIASHALVLDLAPGETRELTFVLGYCENDPEDKWASPGVVNKAPARELLARYATTEQTLAAFEDLGTYWRDLLGALSVTSGDERLDRTVGTWNPYQCMVTFNLSRSASYFETGIGRGMGFRDSNQDLLGFVHLIPERARERILDIAATQLPDGSAYHQYQPLTKRGNDEIGSGFNDDPLWLILGVSAYVRETGNLDILDELVPFDNDPASAAPLFEHLRRSFHHVLEHRGPHGLPLIGRADWNDCLNLNCFSTEPGESFQTTGNRTGGVAESVLIAGMFAVIGPDYVELARRYGEAGEAEAAAKEVAEMREAVRVHAWDGDWYLRAYDYFGDPVGSSTCEEGRIYIESQGFCAWAGIGAEEGLPGRALDAVEEHLGTEHGLVILDPPYSTYHLELGEVSTYPPGYKENGGIFCHNNPWVIIAEAVSGRPERAWDHYRRITPAYREDISEVHRLEPYVYAQMIAGKAAVRHGEAKNSWLSGTAAWCYTAVTQYLLGVRPDFDGLVVAPVVADLVGGFTLTRRFRGATYVVTAHTADDAAPAAGPGAAPDGAGQAGASGVGEGGQVGSRPAGRLVVDGTPVVGNLVPAAPAGSTVRIDWYPL